MDGEIFYDGCWLHRFHGQYYADAPSFRYHAAEVLQWPTMAQDQRSTAQDFWYYCFKPEPGMVIVDVGAGSGTDTQVFSEAVGPTGKVIAIEAHPQTFAMLQATCRWNSLGNVTSLNRAVMDRSCEVYIENQANHVENSVAVKKGANHLGTPIPASSLDDVCRELDLPRIDYVKINIEGAERFVIRGMDEVARRARAVTIACHDFRARDGAHYCTRRLVSEFLRSQGFRLVTRDDDSRRFVRDHVYGIQDHEA